MKIFVLVTVITFVLLINACKKDNSESNRIIYETANITLIKESTDTIERGVFEIYKEGDIYQTRLSKATDSMICDCGISYATTTNTNELIAFNKNDFISQTNNWVNPSKYYSLTNFKGMDKKYIGVRTLSYGDGNKRYFYGWMQIKLSKNCDTLEIIDYASNWMDDIPIKAGQTE